MDLVKPGPGLAEPIERTLAQPEPQCGRLTTQNLIFGGHPSYLRSRRDMRRVRDGDGMGKYGYQIEQIGQIYVRLSDYTTA